MKIQKFYISEATSQKDVRKKLNKFAYNIEFVQSVTGAHLEYEKQNEDLILRRLYNL